MKTITFQKQATQDRPAGFLSRWYYGTEFVHTHYCITVPYELYEKMKYDISDGPIDPETGEPTRVRTLKGVTYKHDIERFKAEHSTCETETIYTEDTTLLQEVPING